jgi:hypothetical protein
MPLLIFALTFAEDGFVLVGQERGVAVYRHDRRDGFELAADGVLAAPPDQVMRVLTDYANHPRWGKGITESRILASAPGALDVYQRLDLPLLDDRDYTLHVTWGADGDARWIRFATANDRGPPPVRGVVRVAVHEGSWRLEPVAGGTRAWYRFHLDLAGSLPAWMGRGRAGKTLFDFFERLRDQLQYYR